MIQIKGWGMSKLLRIRPINKFDYEAWLPLWDGYNAFYGRHGPTALDLTITQATWARFLNDHEPVHAFVAEQNGQLIGLVHYIFHRSTTRLPDVCYLQDLYVNKDLRGAGVGRQLIKAVYDAAQTAGSTRVYWQTQDSNTTARTLYDKVANHLGFIVYSQEV
jgi:GNAT superfamily N-acetyltransferase